ncbi:MAG: hypothetical protein PUF37_00895 [Prevotellaceae bacterium]|nr:hypothetical protein [Prevotellaceae bacterium]
MKKFTKILGLALLAVMAVCMTSCGGDDDPGNITDGTENNGGNTNSSTKATYSMELSFSDSFNQYEGGVGAFEVVGAKAEDCSLTSDNYTGEWTVLNSEDNSGVAGKMYAPKETVKHITVTTGPNAVYLMYENTIYPKTENADKLTINVKVKKNGKEVFSKEYTLEGGHGGTLMISSIPMDKQGSYDIFKTF